jgi:hypothetical protein
VIALRQIEVDRYFDPSTGIFDMILDREVMVWRVE